MARRTPSSTPCEPGVSDGKLESPRTSSLAHAANSTKRRTRSTRCHEPQCCAGTRSMSVEKRVRAYLELAAKDADAADLLLAGGNPLRRVPRAAGRRKSHQGAAARSGDRSGHRASPGGVVQALPC